MSRHTEVAEILIDIEAQLRQIGQWDRLPPSREALASSQPFCVDTLTLPQWLQFIFLPTLYQILEEVMLVLKEKGKIKMQKDVGK